MDPWPQVPPSVAMEEETAPDSIVGGALQVTMRACRARNKAGVSWAMHS